MSNGLSAFLLFLLPISLATLFGVIDVKAYSQISTYGSSATTNDGPKLFKAINADLIYPETFNSSNNVISTTRVPSTITTLATFSAHYTPDSSSDAAIPVTPVLYVTQAPTPPPPSPPLPAPPSPLPLSLTSITSKVHNDQMVEANQMQVETQSDYPKQLLREEAYENEQQNNNQQQQQLQQQQQQFTSTGRAVDYRPAYQLDQFINAAKHYKAPPPPQRPAQYYAFQPTRSYPVRTHKGQTTKVLPYPQNSYRHYRRPLQVFRRPSSQAEVHESGRRAQINDRFTPGEAVASALFTKNGHKHNHHAPSNNANKIAASSNFVQSYVPPNDLYAFPPNINAKYPSPSEEANSALASMHVNSYVPPAAGPIKTDVNYPLVTSANDNQGYQYSGPVNPTYLPPNGMSNEKPPKDDETDTKPMDSSSDAEDNDDTVGVLPASAMDDGGDANKDSGMDSDSKGMDDGDHDYNHDHPPMSYDTGKEYPTPPPGWMEEHPEHYDHGPSFPYFSHHYPEIIYDDHHHDFHHDHHPPIEPSTTLPPPPPPLPSEQPQEARVKKYSYFYIGRKLWYIPLYFTIWFSFYVLWLILKSIARHKVNLPNHYTARTLRSLPDFTEETAKEYINQLTDSVLQQIEDFQKKYIT